MRPGSCRAVTTFPEAACAGAALEKRLLSVCRIRVEGKYVVGPTVLMCVQHLGERIADRAKYRVFRLRIPVKLVRRTEEMVGLRHEHVCHRLRAAVCCRDEGGSYAVVYKPGTNELKSVRVRADKLLSLFLRKICNISETEQHTLI